MFNCQHKTSFIFFPQVLKWFQLTPRFQQGRHWFQVSHAPVVSAVKGDRSRNVKQVTITSAATWEGATTSCQPPKLRPQRWPVPPLSARTLLLLTCPVLALQPVLQQFSPEVQPSGALSVPLVVTFEG